MIKGAREALLQCDPEDDSKRDEEPDREQDHNSHGHSRG